MMDQEFKIFKSYGFEMDELAAMTTEKKINFLKVDIAMLEGDRECCFQELLKQDDEKEIQFYQERIYEIGIDIFRINCKLNDYLKLVYGHLLDS